jgi:hypothetical protein
MEYNGILANTRERIMVSTPKKQQLTIDSPEKAESKIISPFQNSKAIFLQQAGSFADDDSLPDLRDSIYQARGRSETDNDVSL